MKANSLNAEGKSLIIKYLLLHFIYSNKETICKKVRESSGSVVECLTQDQGAAGYCVVSVSKNINPS